MKAYMIALVLAVAIGLSLVPAPPVQSAHPGRAPLQAMAPCGPQGDTSG